MKIYFEKTNGNNKVIFTDGKTAKVFDGAPTGRVDGVDLYGENAAEELRKKYEPAAFDFEDVSDHNEVDFEEIEEELEESELICTAENYEEAEKIAEDYAEEAGTHLMF